MVDDNDESNFAIFDFVPSALLLFYPIPSIVLIRLYKNLIRFMRLISLILPLKG